jgi:BirA family transcriptional regulator, biotin operon repressor / biotin---[acetyl-CoA-carboxylase] ligase
MRVLPASILQFDSLESTNTEAARQAMNGAEEGLCVVAGEQTAGRGRFERQWISPKGAGLYFSLLLRPRIDQNDWPLLTMMASVAVHEALAEACDLHADIKWPNDILVNERKLCGILAETLDTKTGRAVIIGIGINLTSKAFPPELQNSATSVQAVTGKTCEREPILWTLVRALERYYDVAQSPDGKQKIIQEWCARSSYARDKRIRVEDSNETIEGITCGVESDGGLRVETDEGEVKIVRAGDVMAVRTIREAP